MKYAANTFLVGLACFISFTCQSSIPATNTNQGLSSSSSPTPTEQSKSLSNRERLSPGRVASLRLRSGLLAVDRKSDLNENGSVINVRYLVSWNDRAVTIINERFVDLEGYHHLAELNTDVVIISTASGGNACPKKLVLIAFNANGLLHASPEFGNCHEDPTFTSNSSTLRIDFPHGDNPVAETWSYGGGGLRRVKPGDQ